jgi:type I restriction enzyme S subunit
MAGEWETAALETLIEPGRGISYGIVQPGSPVSEGVPIVRVSDVRNGRIATQDPLRVSPGVEAAYSRTRLAGGELLLTIVGTIGETAIVPAALAGWNTARAVAVIPVRKDVGSYWVQMALRGPAVRAIIDSRLNTTVQATLNLRDVAQLPIVLPPRRAREAIAHILGTLDDKIELNRRMNETLEAMARALFKSWFVDFDPTRAKAEGRDPGLPKPLAGVFPDRFEHSELGEIPAGWAVKTIEAIATRVGMGPFGSSIKVETFVAAGVPVISGQHLRGFMVEDNTFNFVAPEHAERLKNAIVQRGDVVFTHAGNIGQAAYIPENSRYDRYVISQRQFFMRCDPAQVTPSFVAFYFRSPEGQHRLLANASSSGVPSIARPVTYLRSIQLSIPPNPIMDAFEKLVQPLLLQFRRNLNEVSTLATLRDTLLPKLISGELRVTGLEQAIPGDGHREVERDSRKQP